MKVINVYSAYIKTNLSKNAALGNKKTSSRYLRQKFIKIIDIEDACEIILKVIYLKRYFSRIGSLYYKLGRKVWMLSDAIFDLISWGKY